VQPGSHRRSHSFRTIQTLLSFAAAVEAHPDASVYNRLCDASGTRRLARRASGGDALIRCAALDEVGGYRSELQAGEEPEMTARMRAAGWKIWRMTRHDRA
jgi:hypothetical protein